MLTLPPYPRRGSVWSDHLVQHSLVECPISVDWPVYLDSSCPVKWDEPENVPHPTEQRHFFLGYLIIQPSKDISNFEIKDILMMEVRGALKYPI
ncbi:hypothetical protein QFZ81_007223 [Paenibacillus sp. V4I9]|nr:hypothetical protein [Paenibacillus sp. V4I9]